MAKPHVTRTLGPIHFEDLDPHRFEDLVRQLVYDFRPWKSIESTGRGGADDGFDVRAFEESRVQSTFTEDEIDAEDAPHPMEGNLWMIQCKREREVGPKKIAKIISDGVTAQTSLYGYILAAPVPFSKAAHDRFRDELRSRGVMEFFLWGAGELEDMLFQPKNDHILFAFFGISLVSKRRSKSASVRSTVLAKNKLMRVLGERPTGTVLVRDLSDESYPFEDDYPDFGRNPRWKEYRVHSFYPYGLLVTAAKHFAYVNRDSGEWDYTTAVDQEHAFSGHPDSQWQQRQAQLLAVRGFWELLPRANRAIWVRRELIRFDKIEYIDDKGDVNFKIPHIYIAYDPTRGAFSGCYEQLELNEYTEISLKELSRKRIFPEEFSTPSFGTIYNDIPLTIDDATLSMVQHGAKEITLYAIGTRYDHLKPTDVAILGQHNSRSDGNLYIKVTSSRSVKAKHLLSQMVGNPTMKHDIERQIARALKPSEQVRVVEAVAIFEWQIDQNRPVI